MTQLGTMARALVNVGLANEPKERKKHSKEFKCRKCNSPMTANEGTNTMSCTKCSNYYIFSGEKDA